MYNSICIYTYVTMDIYIFPKQCLHVEGSYLVSIGIAYKSGIAGRRPRYLSLGT